MKKQSVLYISGESEATNKKRADRLKYRAAHFYLQASLENIFQQISAMQPNADH